MADKGGLLARSEFPLYVVKSLDERHFLVAGGGGAAKTGIANAIEVYEVKLQDGKLQAVSICRHDTGSQAIMNGTNVYDGRHHHFAAGLDDECHVYSLKYKVISPKKKTADDGNLRKRKGDSSSESTQNSTGKQIMFDIDEIKSTKTDFNKDSSFQKVAQISPSRSFIATGGTDGYLRVWKFPGLEKMYEVHGHKNDIDDIDISPSGDKIVTVSRDHCACVWNSKDGSKITNLKWPLQSDEHRYRCCRYGLIEGNKDKFNLYTISIPNKRSAQKPLPCFITMWNSEKFAPKRMINAGTEVLSSLAVSDDGVYIAVGTISGSVAVYISFSLQKLYYKKEAHSIFVTGIEFMPSSEGAREVTGNQDFTLLSISADNTIRMHQVAARNSYSVLLIVFGALLIVLMIFVMLGEYGI
ncbi:prolactin regulatory element-binding protein-like isoform X1 [Pecten maximus]|uniref:prolactin regulatory element-binding protein-like isoform X1 n=1 Tax=Pecten maximus TaxID=6579 RepID=UPI001457E93D|nr:prolactin regulatory element-binding protein-like isoform X1 [Pecten maximus]